MYSDIVVGHKLCLEFPYHNSATFEYPELDRVRDRDGCFTETQKEEEGIPMCWKRLSFLPVDSKACESRIWAFANWQFNVYSSVPLSVPCRIVGKAIIDKRGVWFPFAKAFLGTWTAS